MARIGYDTFESGGIAAPVGNLEWTTAANVQVLPAVGFEGSYGLSFNFEGLEENGDSWAEQRFRAQTTWGTDVWFKFRLFVPSDVIYPATGGTRNDKLLNVWYGGPDRTGSNTAPNVLLTLLELVPENYSLSGTLVTPATVGLYPRLASAAAEPYETREPDRHDTWAIYAPLIRPVDVGTWIQIRVHFHAQVDGSYAKIWRGSTLCGETIASDYSFLTPDWATAQQKYTNGYLLGYANTGVLGDWVVDDFEVHNSDPDAAMAVTLGVNAGFVTVRPTADPVATAVTVGDGSASVRDVSPTYSSRLYEIGWWCDNATPAANWEAGLYSDAAANDEPNTRFAAQQTNAKGPTAGWKSSPVFDVRLVPSTPYWVAFQLDDTTPDTQFDVASPATGKWATKAGTTLPSPWGTSLSKSSTILGTIYGLIVPHIPPKIHHARRQ
jgi:hypothetical protein